MKPAPNTLVQFDELPGDEIEFSIGDPRWVMRVSAKQYSDVTTAIIREYSTNAYDAHVMAGHRDPIEVTLPSLMDPRFIVRDHGIGMNRETFKEIYTQFGISDKRESNDFNGQLGYGSKSGLAYTDSFTVSSVKDGVLTEAVVMRRPDWSIVLKIVSESKTDLPNGTEITFVINNVEEFIHKAHAFYKFWLPGRVLVNGKPVEHHVGMKITDNLYYSKQWATSYVVMGNVAYRIANPEALFRNTKMSSLNFVAYVDDFKTIDGAQPVEFTPSREDLEYSDRTKATLQAIVNQFERDIVTKAKADIDAAKTHAEAFTAWSKWTSVLGKKMFDELTFKGDSFKSDFPFHGKRYQTNYGQGSTMAIREWGVESMNKTMIVSDFNIEVSSNVKKKAVEYAEHVGWDRPLYILFTHATSFDSPWVDWKTAHVVTWADLKAALPKAAPKPRVFTPGDGRVPGSWDYVTRAGCEYEQEIPKDAKTLYHISVQQEKYHNVRQILTEMDSDAVVLIVPANRLAKLNREHPRVTDFVKAARAKVVVDGETLLSDDAKKAMSVDDQRRNWSAHLDLTRVDDPQFAEYYALTKNKDALVRDYQRNLRLANWLHMGYNGVKKFVPVQPENLFKKYPLLSGQSYMHIHDHVYMYLNAAHAAAELEKKNV